MQNNSFDFFYFFKILKYEKRIVSKCAIGGILMFLYFFISFFEAITNIKIPFYCYFFIFPILLINCGYGIQTAQNIFNFDENSPELEILANWNDILKYLWIGIKLFLGILLCMAPIFIFVFTACIIAAALSTNETLWGVLFGIIAFFIFIILIILISLFLYAPMMLFIQDLKITSLIRWDEAISYIKKDIAGYCYLILTLIIISTLSGMSMFLCFCSPAGIILLPTLIFISQIFRYNAMAYQARRINGKN